MRVKKCLSILLTLVMVLSLMPATAFAADTYTVTFNSDGGSAVESQTLFPGEKAAGSAGGSSARRGR